jgi:UTP--glucose-1-phosphate uridylyltransferase
MMPRMSIYNVKTAVFPVAGRGTRFLPATKASPKEMLPIVDKPLIQYAAEEALSAGAETLVFITGSSKRAIEDHFDSDPELEAALQEQGKQDLLDTLRGILPSWAACVYIRQPAPLGLGHAVLCARPVVGNAPFMVHLADDLIDAKVPCLRQMVKVHATHGGSVLGVQTVPKSETDKYGIVSVEDHIAPRVSRIKHIVEKPKPAKAPSNLAVVGRYLLTGQVFEELMQIGKGAGGEIQLTDGIARLMKREYVYAYEFEGKRYDCGSKLGYLQATVEYGLNHSKLGKDFRRYLKILSKDL